VDIYVTLNAGCYLHLSFCRLHVVHSPADGEEKADCALYELRLGYRQALIWVAVPAECD
jgi:hypothetical protein